MATTSPSIRQEAVLLATKVPGVDSNNVVAVADSIAEFIINGTAPEPTQPGRRLSTKVVT